MPKVSYKKEAGSVPFRSIGSAACTQVAVWQRQRPEVICRTKQLNRFVTIVFLNKLVQRNRPRAGLTEVQTDEIDKFIASLTATLGLHLVRKQEVIEQNRVTKIEVVLEQK